MWVGILRRNGVAIVVNKRVRNAVLGCSLKNDRMISVRFQGKPFNTTVIQAYAPPGTLNKLKLNSFEKTLILEGLGAGGERDDRV